MPTTTRSDELAAEQWLDANGRTGGSSLKTIHAFLAGCQSVRTSAEWRAMEAKLTTSEKEVEELREKLEEVIRIATLGMAFAPKGPVRPNLAPMFYHTLNYESEVITQKIIDDAREALQAIALKGKGKV